MANRKLSYFLAPAWHYKPEDPIALGNIITDPRRPEDALNSDAHIYLPSLSVDFTKADYRAVLYQNQDTGIGISASVLSFLGLGGDLSVHSKKDLAYTFNAERLRTQQFSPNFPYVEASMQLAGVIKYLKDTKYRRDLYMITGIQIAYGGSINSFTKAQRGFSTQVGVNGIPAGILLEIGPHLSSFAGSTVEVSFGHAEEFVFAYRLKKISYMKKIRSFKVKDHTKGTTFGHDRDPKGPGFGMNTAQAEEVAYAEPIGLDEEEIGGEKFELQESVTALTNHDEILEYVVPEAGVNS